MAITYASDLAYMTRGVFTDQTFQNPPVFVPGETLDNSPASILAQYIIEVTSLMSLPNADTDWPLYVHHLPPADDAKVKTNAGAVMDTAGLKDGRLMAGPTMQHYGMQILMRGKTYEEAWVKINAVARSLDGIHTDVITRGIEDYMIDSVTQTSNPVYIGLEEGQGRRKLFTVNLIATIKQVE